MKNLLENIRVYDGTRRLTGDELVAAVVNGAEFDRAVGVTAAGQQVFENDYMLLKIDDELRSTMFMNSNIGKHITEHNFETLVVLVKSTNTLDVRGDCLFVRNGVLVSSFDVGDYADPEDDEHARRIAERQAADKLELYAIPDSERQFIDYLVRRGLVVNGNVHEHVGEVAELLAQFAETHKA